MIIEHILPTDPDRNRILNALHRDRCPECDAKVTLGRLEGTEQVVSCKPCGVSFNVAPVFPGAPRWFTVVQRINTER
jgi:uncharacterized paraquat-inducible protein A